MNGRSSVNNHQTQRIRDQAFEEVGVKLLDLREKYGPETVTFWNITTSLPPSQGLDTLLGNRLCGLWGGTDPLNAYGLDNGLPDGRYFANVRTLGSGEGIDRPSGVWPGLRMSWMPYYTHHCIKRKPRTEAGELPYCVKNCPNKALAYGADAVEKIEAAPARGARICQLPEWEHGKEGVIYASPDREIT